jgi:hypothetical protein
MDLVTTIQDAWGWVGIKPAQILGDNSFGNLLIKDEVGLYWRLCPEDLYCKVVAIPAQTSTHFLKAKNS